MLIVKITWICIRFLFFEYPNFWNAFSVPISFNLTCTCFEHQKEVTTITSFYLCIYLWGYILWPALYLACSAFCLCLASCPHSCPCAWHCLNSLTYIFSNNFSSYAVKDLLHSFLHIISLSGLCLQLLIISLGSGSLVCSCLRSLNKHGCWSSLTFKWLHEKEVSQ